MSCSSASLAKVERERERETERETERERETDRQTDRHSQRNKTNLLVLSSCALLISCSLASLAKV